MKHKFIAVFFLNALFPLFAYSYTETDMVSIGCSESSRAFGYTGININNELNAIKNDKKQTPESSKYRVDSLRDKMKSMENEIYNIISRDRDKLFNRFGDMIYVDMYILINSGTPTRSFVLANENPKLNIDQLMPALNAECISDMLAGIESVRSKRR